MRGAGVSDFATRVVRAGTQAVDERAGMLCGIDFVMSVRPIPQVAMAAVATAFRLAAQEGVSPADLAAAAEWIEKRWLVDAARPSHLRVVKERKAS
jgi:hypothetical protein